MTANWDNKIFSIVWAIYSELEVWIYLSQRKYCLTSTQKGKKNKPLKKRQISLWLHQSRLGFQYILHLCFRNFFKKACSTLLFFPGQSHSTTLFLLQSPFPEPALPSPSQAAAGDIQETRTHDNHVGVCGFFLAVELKQWKDQTKRSHPLKILLHIVRKKTILL